MGNIRCPKCRKMINEKDKKCEYCGFDGIQTYVSKQKRTESENKGKSSSSNSNSVISKFNCACLRFGDCCQME